MGQRDHRCSFCRKLLQEPDVDRSPLRGHGAISLPAHPQRNVLGSALTATGSEAVFVKEH